MRTHDTPIDLKRRHWCLISEMSTHSSAHNQTTWVENELKLHLDDSYVTHSYTHILISLKNTAKKRYL